MGYLTSKSQICLAQDIAACSFQSTYIKLGGNSFIDKSLLTKMCEEDRVEYLRDLINENDNLDKQEEHSVLNKLLTQGN